MTPIQYLAYILGLQTDQQVGFLLSVLVAFWIGWEWKAWSDKRRLIRWKRRLWSGEKLDSGR